MGKGRLTIGSSFLATRKKAHGLRRMGPMGDMEWKEGRIEKG